MPSAPQVVGVARVIPRPAADPGLRSDAEIETIGMRVALEHERREGRAPADVSRENLGYDLRSEAPDGAVRYIEVKARATTGAVVLTPNEWLMARRLGDEYWLYVVEHAAAEPRLFTLRNPAAKLRPEEVVELVRLVVKDWRQHAA